MKLPETCIEKLWELLHSFHSSQYGCWTKNRGILPAKWVVKIMENPNFQMGWFGGFSHYFWKHPYLRIRHIWCFVEGAARGPWLRFVWLRISSFRESQIWCSKSNFWHLSAIASELVTILLHWDVLALKCLQGCLEWWWKESPPQKNNIYIYYTYHGPPKPTF